MYVLTTDHEGKVASIEDVDSGANFGVDATVTLPQNATVFLNRHALSEYCRRKGLLLYAGPDGVPSWSQAEHGGVAFEFVSVAYSAAQRKGQLAGHGIEPRNVNFAIPRAEWLLINDDLKNEDSDVRHISSLPVFRTFVYIDVSDFSKYDAGEEALIINSLSAIVYDASMWTGVATRVYRTFKTMLCIGDGYIFVFDEPVKATLFAGYLAELIEVLVANDELPVNFHFRMGAHVGSVYSFWDPGRAGWNYVGDGINGGNRVLAAVGKAQDDTVFISSQLRTAVQASKSEDFRRSLILTCLTNRGRKADKHGNPWRVYELNHAQLCAADVPSKYRTNPLTEEFDEYA
jgi:class 3 adenylate cyclase